MRGSARGRGKSRGMAKAMARSRRCLSQAQREELASSFGILRVLESQVVESEARLTEGRLWGDAGVAPETVLL